MTEQLSGLQVGLMMDFLDPTLVIAGDPRLFAELARQVADRQIIEFDLIAAQPPAKLRFVPVEGCGRFHRREDTFLWEMSASESVKVADLLMGLTVTDTPGHAYLDPDVNEVAVQLLASKGEYDLARMLCS